MITNSTITVSARNRLPHGTVRRAPAPSFAHAILLDQMGREQEWQIIDVYGPMEVETDVDVQDWPIVYIPAPDEVWQEIVPPIPLHDACVPECTEDQSARMEEADGEQGA